MNRRGFLKSILAAGVAPAFVGSSVLMPIRALSASNVGFVQSGTGATPLSMQAAFRLYGDGVHDDTAAMQAWLDGKPVLGPSGDWMARPNDFGARIEGGSYRISSTLYMGGARPARSIHNSQMIGPVAEGPMIHYTPRDGEFVSPLENVYCHGFKDYSQYGDSGQ